MPNWPSWPFAVDDPYPGYHAARKCGGVQWHDGLGACLVLDHEPAAMVLLSNACSSDPRTSPELLAALGGAGAADMWTRSMLTSDPPEHTRLRAAANRYFTPRAAAQLRDRVDAIIEEALAPLHDGEPIELMADVAYPLSTAVIAELFDIGIDGARLLREQMPALARMLDLDPTPQALQEVAAAALDVMLFLVPLAAQRRLDPGEDLLSALLHQSLPGPSLSTDEAITTSLLLLAAGHETTATVIGNATAALLEHPDQLHWLASHPDQAATAAEELLRFDPPVQVVQRIARRDLELHDVRLRAGDQILVLPGAANRDPARYAEPDRLHLARGANGHLAFGLGPHFCLGAGLARLEIERLLLRLPQLMSGWEPSQATVSRDTSRTFRRIAALHVGADAAVAMPASGKL